MRRRQLFSWWKRGPLWFRHCFGEAGHYFETTQDQHAEEPRIRWVLRWCRSCGECREVDIR